MPAPKDPEKYRQWKEKIAASLKGIKYPNRKSPKPQAPEAIERMRQAQIRRGNDPEERKRRSERAKANGYGKWMKGKTLPAEQVEKMAAHKRGKTYEEIYGEDRADQERQNRRTGNKRAKAGKRPPHLLVLQQQIAEDRKGKTYEEIYGEERAKQEVKQRQETHRARAKGKPRRVDVRPRQGISFEYNEWRKAVFKRDDYTCQRCGKRGGRLQAHHIKAWAKYPDLRYDVANGITYCVECHKQHHREHGK